MTDRATRPNPTTTPLRATQMQVNASLSFSSSHITQLEHPLWCFSIAFFLSHHTTWARAVMLLYRFLPLTSHSLSTHCDASLSLSSSHITPLEHALWCLSIIPSLLCIFDTWWSTFLYTSPFPLLSFMPLFLQLFFILLYYIFAFRSVSLSHSFFLSLECSPLSLTNTLFISFTKFISLCISVSNHFLFQYIFLCLLVFPSPSLFFFLAQCMKPKRRIQTKLCLHCRAHWMSITFQGISATQLCFSHMW